MAWTAEEIPDQGGRTAVVTGANSGLGLATARELARAGARVVMACRNLGKGEEARLAIAGAVPGAQLELEELDLSSLDSVRAFAERYRGAHDALDLLINNAGIWLYDDLSDRAMLEEHLAVNFYGTWGVTQAFLPLLTRSKGTIVNNVSLMALAALPLTPAYSASKAAAFSLTQSLRALLAGRGVRVHAVLTGPVDTDMTRSLDIPKASPASVARAIFDGVENGEEDIFPDPMSALLADGWRDGVAKALERQNAALAQAQPVTA
jgi:NAD(P)-dependent dehydrogenase (short-subunit alcohol dehydrogenase family)